MNRVLNIEDVKHDGPLEIMPYGYKVVEGGDYLKVGDELLGIMMHGQWVYYNKDRGVFVESSVIESGMSMFGKFVPFEVFMLN